MIFYGLHENCIFKKKKCTIGYEAVKTEHSGPKKGTGAIGVVKKMLKRNRIGKDGRIVKKLFVKNFMMFDWLFFCMYNE